MPRLVDVGSAYSFMYEYGYMSKISSRSTVLLFLATRMR